MSIKEVSPKITILGSVEKSILAQRRASKGSKDNLRDGNYYKYEDYDNVSLHVSNGGGPNNQPSKMSWYVKQ